MQQKDMSCTKPLVRFDNGEITSLKNYLEYGRKRGTTFYMGDGPYLDESSEKKLLRKIKEERCTLIPCGQCAACKLTASSSWANRMEMELPYHENAWFVTLTYNDENIPYRYTWDNGTGEVITENYSLNYDDLTKFWKRLRRYIDYNIEDYKGNLMYYAAGEYGSTTHRPHYHAIIYDLPIEKDNLKEYKRRAGAVYYNCEWLEKVWGLGFVVIAPAEWKAMAYTARYTTKKVYGKEGKEFYESLGILPEDNRMSLKPAIGTQYYYDHAEEIYRKDQIYLKNGKICKPPRYFDKLFDLEHSNAKPLSADEERSIEDTIKKAESEEMRAIKRERRRIANDALFAQLKQTGLTMQEYYTLRDAKMQERMKKLIRNEV